MQIFLFSEFYTGFILDLYHYIGYAKAGKILFQKATNSESYWPIWGTCLGNFVCNRYEDHKNWRNLNFML